MTKLCVFQLNFMLLLSGICGTIAFFVALTQTIEAKRKKALIVMEVGAMVLLMADRFSYIYRGSTSDLGFIMVRISNFMVFFMTLFLLETFNHYLRFSYSETNNNDNIPRRFQIVDALFVIGCGLLIISQFTGLYYTFDTFNRYHRADGFIICYSIPIIMVSLQLSLIIQCFKKLPKRMRTVMLLFTVTPIAASIVQIFVYGLSLTNITLVGMIILLYVYTITDSNKTVIRAQKLEMEYLKEEHQHYRIIYEQISEALASAIDAKDKYTHGHSRRVAEYSEMIARLSGIDEKNCEEIYFAGLLHDVGKIGVPDAIINKEGKLTDEEFAEIKKHPIIGKQILSSINRSPYLSIAANYHHERYDGRGYPEGLKGENIPQIARIIAVADAYDAMTSKRSYRGTMPQQIVREEFVKGIGTQFDPEYARIMIHLIDEDIEYAMREENSIEGENFEALTLGDFRSDYTKGIRVTDVFTDINFSFAADKKNLSPESVPTVILFDSLDEAVHTNEKEIKSLLYFEYAEICLDGKCTCKGARDIKAEITESSDSKPNDQLKKLGSGISCSIEAVRFKDHLRIIVRSEFRTIDVIVALPDTSRFSYIALTGKNCTISNISSAPSQVKVNEKYIPRIADAISYIDAPNGDIPNLQIDSIRSSATEGIPVNNKLKITFHSQSLPTSRLVWHCPYVVLFSSDDGNIGGKNYHEYDVIRMNGECLLKGYDPVNKITVTKSSAFEGWDKWKQLNKNGVDCIVSISRKDNIVTVTTVNGGITTTNVTAVPANEHFLFAALTGDQCALTNIRIKKTEDILINL